MYRAAPYAWEAESGSVAQITCVIEMRRETLIMFPSRQRPIAARAGYARGHLSTLGWRQRYVGIWGREEGRDGRPGAQNPT